MSKDEKPRKVITPYYQRPPQEQIDEVKGKADMYVFGAIIIAVLLVVCKSCAG